MRQYSNMETNKDIVVILWTVGVGILVLRVENTVWQAHTPDILTNLFMKPDILFADWIIKCSTEWTFHCSILLMTVLPNPHFLPYQKNQLCTCVSLSCLHVHCWGLLCFLYSPFFRTLRYYNAPFYYLKVVIYWWLRDTLICFCISLIRII